MSQTSNGKEPVGPDFVTKHPLSPLLRALSVTTQTSILCAEFRSHLSELYHLMQSEAPLPKEFQPYMDHLATCPTCAEEYTALVEALAEFDAGTLPDLDHIPQFDLSFMDEGEVATPTPPAMPPALWLAPLADGLRRLIDDIWIVVQSTRARFDTLPLSLSPLEVAEARFRSDVETGPAEVLVLPAPDAGFSVHLTVGLVVNGKAAIAVKIVEPNTMLPVADIRIALRNRDHQLLAGAVTGHDGTSLFEQLPLGRYFVQVRHTDQTWEIPLMIVEGKSTT